MNAVLLSFRFMLRSCFRTRAAMQIEILALRHQLAALQRDEQLASLRTADRLLWVMLSRLCPDYNFKKKATRIEWPCFLYRRPTGENL